MTRPFPCREQIDRENALPPASIIDKLQKHVPDAGIDILNKINDFSQSPEKESNVFESLARTFTSKAFWDGFTDVITLSPPFTTSARRAGRPANQNIYDQSWITVGNNMRRAIIEVMNENNLSSRDIGLSPKEKNALAFLPYSRHQNRYTA